MTSPTRSSRRSQPFAGVLPSWWWLLLLALVFGFSGVDRLAAQGPVTQTYTYSPGVSIPDNSTVGVADTRNVSSSILTITHIRLTLNITGGFNGDFYAYLRHDSGNSTGFAVLLDRVGRTSTSPFGYADSGFSGVVFDDATLATTNGDIHIYQGVSNPAGGALSGGVWQSDGRTSNPAVALDSDARSAFLTSFNTLDPNGAWTLFIADASPVGSGTFTGWSLEITGLSVPEPSTWALVVGGLGLLGAGQRVVRRGATARGVV